ncbi:hypothetical protein OQA88_762 [Cercophora sp. LCS_1]
MAVDPLTAITAITQLLDISARTSSGLHHLYRSFKNGPDIILALSNEVADLSLVLDSIHGAKRSLMRLKGSEHRRFVDTLTSQLAQAEETLAKIDSITRKLLRQGRSAQRVRWILYQSKAALLKDEMREVRRRINELMTAENITISTSIHLQLRDIYIRVHDGLCQAVPTASQAPDPVPEAADPETAREGLENGTLPLYQDMTEKTLSDTPTIACEKATHEEEQPPRVKDGELENTNLEMQHRISTLEGAVTALLVESSAMNQRYATHTTRHRKQITGSKPPAIPSESFGGTDAIYFSVMPSHARCAEDCPCRCHQPTPPDVSWTMPSAMRSIAGLLFIGYSGLPTNNSCCDSPLCIARRSVRLQVTYAFPLWFMWVTLHFLLEASMKGSFRFGLVVRRRIVSEPGNNILFVSERGTPDEVRRLLAKNTACLLEVDRSDGCSALHAALKVPPGVDIRKVRLLLQAGADPDYEDDFGFSPRHEAARKILLRDCRQAVLDELDQLFSISSHADELNLTSLHKVVTKMFPISLVSFLKSYTARPDVSREALENLVNAQDRFGATALHYAVAKCNDADATAALLLAGARLDLMTNGGSTPLHWAAGSMRGGDVERTVRLLLDAGADVHQKNPLNAQRPLTYAAGSGNYVAAKLLLAAGSDLDYDENGATCYYPPLLSAVAEDDAQMARLLIEHGADLEGMDHTGNTAILYAVGFNAVKSLPILVQAGASHCHVGDMGSVLHCAAASGSVETMAALAGYGLELDLWLKNKEGLTAAQVFGQRLVVSDELREAFANLVVSVSGKGEKVRVPRGEEKGDGR